MPELTHLSVLETLSPVVRAILTGLGDKASDKATEINPVFGAITASVISQIITDENIEYVVNEIHYALTKLFGEDYPTKVVASNIVWEDNR